VRLRNSVFNFIRWKIAGLQGCVIASLALLFFVGEFPARAQQAPEQQSQPRDQMARPGSSDLMKENMGRVAASVGQIKAILVKDPGIMVELKTWVAKDAADHGQIVSDSELTDQAMFDRLIWDVQFRSIATRLLQRYGYLLPTVNPDSDLGKQQDLLMKERALQYAKSEEDARANRNQQREDQTGLERARTCDPQLDRDCDTENPRQQQGSRTQKTRSQSQGPEQRQGGEPGNERQNQPQRRQVPNYPQDEIETNNPQLTQTAAAAGALGSRAGQLAGGPLPFSSETDLSGLSGFPQRLSGLDGSGEPERPLPTNRREAEFSNNNNNSLRTGEASMRKPRSEAELVNGMVRRPNPYSSIPSLYDMYMQAPERPRRMERFGIDVFSDGTRDSDMIPMDLPVGPDYVVGPGDSLTISLWGGVSQRLYRTVDREGRVSLPEAGPVLVSGRTLSDVQQSVQQILRTQFRDVSADISLTRLRTIRVYVVGDVQHAGAYDISSLSTPLNALFEAGGPTDRGSLRIVQHFRGKKLVQDVDVYDLLLHGVKDGILPLENGDTVLVPPIHGQVTVEGMVRRPSLYELNSEKNLAQVLELAGGILPAATLRHIEVQRLVAHEKHTMLSLDIPEVEDADFVQKKLEAFPVQDGDTIRIFPIASFNQDIVYLQGHVLRPGRYSYRQGMKITDLVSSYKDLLPEPSAKYAEIVRLNPPDFHPSVVGFDLAAALSNPAAAPTLEPMDTIRIYGRFDLQSPPTVSVLGEVRSPGTYNTPGQIHLWDAIILAGGLTPDSQTNNVQVFQYLPDSQLKILSVNLNDARDGKPLDNILLESRDRVVVHKNLAQVDPATVIIQGEVGRPGRYPLTTNLTVADLIRVAGGAKRSASLQNADLTRSIEDPNKTPQHQSVNVEAALAGDKTSNVPLNNGDVLTIPQLPGWNDLGATIVVRGEVSNPGTYGIHPGDRLSTILKLAGGFQPDSYPYGAVLERTQVREMEERTHVELMQRVKAAQTELVTSEKTEVDPDKKKADAVAFAQWQVTLETLANNPPAGRVTIRISSDIRHWENTPQDIPVRAGDILIVPKKPNYVMVMGQVYNPTAVSYRPGKNARWYLSQAGGPTNLANKKAIFAIRADGTVLGTKSGLFSGDSLSAVLQPGDSVMVPEKALGSGITWKDTLQTAQIASAIAQTIVIAIRF
jgi:protein involved in polysaccharide export with SLBB domain